MSALDRMVSRTRELNQLQSVLLELTYQCNLDCFFCYNDLSMHGRRMQLEDYVRLLDDLAAMNVLGISLSGGEPLAWPHFFTLGAHARKLGFAVTVKTNGHSVGARVARRLHEEVDPFLIETSLHGATPDTHDRQTRVPGSFDRLVKNIRAMREAGLRVKINCTITRLNETEILEMYELADRLDCPMQTSTDISPRDDGDREPLDIRASDTGVAAMHRILARRVAALAPPGPERHTIELTPPGTGGQASTRQKNCAAGSTFATVDPFGNVYPCVQLRKKVGNLHEAGIAEIWAGSPVLDGVRQLSYDANDVREAHGFENFCPGLAELVTGDPLGAYPDIQRTSRIRATVEEPGKSSA